MFCGKLIAHIVFAHIQQIERIEKTIVEMFASCYPTPINVKKKKHNGNRSVLFILVFIINIYCLLFTV